MTVEDFVAALVARYNMAEATRDKGSGETGTRIVPKYKILVSDYREFGRKHEKLLSQTLERLVDEYVYPYPPKKAVLNQTVSALIAEREVQRREEEYRINQAKVVQCEKCKTLYDKRSTVCPNCFCHERTVVTSPDDLHYIKAQENCYRCSYFRQKKKGHTVYGPVCIHYGDYAAGVAAGKETGKNPCEVCSCRDCCKMEWMFETDPRGYKREYTKGSPVYRPDTYTPIWIDPEVPTLGEHFIEEIS